MLNVSTLENLDFIYYHTGDKWYVKKEFGEVCNPKNVSKNSQMKEFSKTNNIRYFYNSLFIDDYLYKAGDFSAQFHNLNIFGIVHRKNNLITIVNDKYSSISNRIKTMRIDKFKMDYIDASQDGT